MSLKSSAMCGLDSFWSGKSKASKVLPVEEVLLGTFTNQNRFSDNDWNELG